MDDPSSGRPLLLPLVILAGLAYGLGLLLYRLFLSPLAKIPGPVSHQRIKCLTSTDPHMPVAHEDQQHTRSQCPQGKPQSPMGNRAFRTVPRCRSNQDWTQLS